MRWDERQVAMLEAMGIRLWAPTRPVAADTRSAEAPGGDGSATVARADGGPPAGSRPTRAALDARDARVAAQAGGSADVADPAGPAAVAVTGPTGVPAETGQFRPPVGQEPASATAAWHALADAAAHCEACGLAVGRTRAVFASGAPPADWLVVGEPPVDAEDRDGTPFAGKPGLLLDAMLRAIGVARDGAAPANRACLTLPVKCRPPGNRAPTADELATCESRFLAAQVELARPKLILALGRSAALLLGSDLPLGRLRGHVHRHLGLPLVATYHPAYLLRNPADKARAWEDLCLAAEVAAAASAVA